MHTPTAALTWELWHRHRRHWIAIVGTLLAFILVYPRLCLLAGFNTGSPDATDEVAREMAPMAGHATLRNMVQMLFILFLAGGPILAMLLSLLCTLWIFTFTEVDSKTKEVLTFPTRLFKLPISTSYLFWLLALGGWAAVLGLSAAWDYCVPMPRLAVFKTFQNGFGWMTLLALGQGIVWALAAWPVSRVLALMAVLFLFLVSPAQADIVESPVILLPLFLLGAALARVGLQRIRHGRWQAWAWKWPFADWRARAVLHGPKRFASPAQAQFWFEWRRATAKICWATAALVLAALVCLLLRAAAGYLPLDKDAMFGCAVSIAAMPLIVFGLHGISPMRAHQDFILVRPQTSGAVIVSMLKATAAGAVLAWVAILAALGILAWLGDFHGLEQRISPLPGRRAALLIGLIFLTWRAAVINLCFVLTGKRWLCQAPVGLMAAAWLGLVLLVVLQQNGVRFDWLWNHLSEIAAGLLVVKFLLAFGGFRRALKRRLLAASAVASYLAVWSLVVAALLSALLLLVRPDQTQVLPACLGVVLLVPLARIGLASLTFAWARHSGNDLAGA
ncbi:MAG TPA: hypothetical protein VL970_11060 [Candidatus Acidoferrales bacterium]|nr:hypothetical protein [Candidatus Acidoferrales bacterium]